MIRSTSLLMVAVFLLAACGAEEARKEATKAKAQAEAASTARFAAMVLATEPEGVLDVVELKEGAKVGDEVVVFGRVRKFSEGYASFVLTGDAMRHCAEREGDMCKTPWDYCCESPSDMADHSVNVEFRDGDRPFKQKLEGVAGLKLLANVVVKGKVADVRDGNVTLAVEGFYLRP